MGLRVASLVEISHCKTACLTVKQLGIRGSYKNDALPLGFVVENLSQVLGALLCF